MPRPERPTIEGKTQKQEDRKERKARLQREADERLTAFTNLTPKQRLKVLDSRPGESKKQRAKIAALIEKDAPKPTPPKAAAPAPVANGAPEPAVATEKAAKGKKGKK